MHNGRPWRNPGRCFSDNTVCCISISVCDSVLLNGYLSCKCQRASLQFLKSAVVRYKKFNNGHMMI